MPVNGNYAPHQGYGSIEPQPNNYTYSNNITTPQPTTNQAAGSSSNPANSTGTQQSDVSKDEVGWYFVEQYYTTLSRNPEKLYLFYQKRSQFVSGLETDKVLVCVGQRAINDKIKELDFQDCKVRVTNVDSQASDSNIVIQVIGEMSNKSQPHKKFTQTFVLATQTNGYFVLNDIFRYLVDEEDEPEQVAPQMEEVQPAPAAPSGYQEPAPTAEEAEPKTLTSSLDPNAVEHDASKVDRELEEKVLKAEEPPAAAVNGVTEVEDDVDHAEDAPVAVPEQTAAEPPRPETKDEDLMHEKPSDPEPTPIATPPPKSATPQPAPAPKPAAPKTWASLAASANRNATPAAPASSSPSTTSHSKSTPSSAKAPTPAPAAPSGSAAPNAPTAQRDESPAAGSQDEWTAVGSSHNRQQSRQTNVQQQEPQNRGYVKNVYENVEYDELRSQLSQYGELAYLDISRPKVCFHAINLRQVSLN